MRTLDRARIHRRSPARRPRRDVPLGLTPRPVESQRSAEGSVASFGKARPTRAAGNVNARAKSSVNAAQGTRTIARNIAALQEYNEPASGTTGQDRIRIASLEPGDTESIVAMLERCSATTLYHRFHGVTSGVPHATQVLMNGSADDAYGAWSAENCIGLASLGAAVDGSADIGVLVEDRWQRRGVGSALVMALVHRARDRRLSTLGADVLGDDRFILPLLARIGPMTTSIDFGGYTARIDLEQGTGTRPGPVGAKIELKNARS